MILTPKQKEKIILWLINARQLTPDQAIDEVNNFPYKCFSMFLKGRITNQENPNATQT